MKFKKGLTFSLVALVSIAGSYNVTKLNFNSKVSYALGLKDEKEEEIKGAIEHMYSMRANEKTGTVDPAWVYQAVDELNSKKGLSKRLNKKLIWENLGPDNIGGRVRTLVFDKDSLNIMWLGAVSGGMWRSTTGGLSWAPVTLGNQNQHVVCAAQTADGSLYYGTGEGGFANLNGEKTGSPASIGDGIYKSNTRSGNSFTRIANTRVANFQQCNSMVAHPTKDEFYVATTTGLFKFTNGGTVNTRVISGNQLEVKMEPSGIIWVSNANGNVRKSDANGDNFQVVNYGNAGGRVSIAISTKDPKYVYLLGSSSARTFTGIWQSKDAGATFQQVLGISASTNPINSFMNDQGSWNNVVGVDPSNNEKLWLGGVELATWDPINGFKERGTTNSLPWLTNYVHSDKHIIQWDLRKGNNVMYVGSDGGLTRSLNGGIDFQNANKNFTTIQLYAVAANYLGHVMGGTQDNSTYLINGNGNNIGGKVKTGHKLFGGDGFDSEMSTFNPNILFASSQFGILGRSANGGQDVNVFWDVRDLGNGKRMEQAIAIPSNFNTEFTLWENKVDTTSRLFLGRDGAVWMAKNPSSFNNPVEWYVVANGLGNSKINSLETTPDGDHLFFSKPGAVYRLDNINSTTFNYTVSPTFLDKPAGLQLVNITGSAFAGRNITSVNVSKTNPSHVVITLGGYGNTSYVFETRDALTAVPTWTNITGNLISVPVFDAVIDTDDDRRIILGTDLGVFATENKGVNWEEANDGMAQVPVWEIRGYEWNPWEGMVMYLGTHGRGFYKSSTLLTNTKKINSGITGLIAYPNPATDKVTVSLKSNKTGTASVAMYDLSGKMVYNKNETIVTGNNSLLVNTAKLNAGTYFVKVTSNEESQTLKIVIQ